MRRPVALLCSAGFLALSAAFVGCGTGGGSDKVSAIPLGTPLQTGLDWFESINRHDLPLALGHFAPADRGGDGVERLQLHLLQRRALSDSLANEAQCCTELHIYRYKSGPRHAQYKLMGRGFEPPTGRSVVDNQLRARLARWPDTA